MRLSSPVGTIGVTQETFPKRILAAMSNVTHILHAIEQGDTKSAEVLLPLVYEELRGLAAAKMANENPGQTLQATALVHEAYLRLVGSETRRTEVAPVRLAEGCRDDRQFRAVGQLRLAVKSRQRRARTARRCAEFRRRDLELDGRNRTRAGGMHRAQREDALP